MVSLLRIDGLRINFATPLGPLTALRGVSLEIEKGSVTGLVGESGCGKTITGRAVLGLLPTNCKIEGTIQFDGVELVRRSQREMQQMRGGRIAMIFQDPAAALNPVFTIGDQLLNVLRRHKPRASTADRLRRAFELLDEVGLADPEQLVRAFPHQISGGMQQRVMIAIALAGSPDLLIADEPTTALDVTVQAQILDLLVSLRASRGLTVLLITHNMAVAARACQRIAVLYAGRVVEEGEVSDVLERPKHPYTRALLGALPTTGRRREPLAVIGGMVPSGLDAISGCVFASRCPNVMPICRAHHPPNFRVPPDRDVACWLYGPGPGESV